MGAPDAFYGEAFHDPLTGLANRNLFNQRLQQAAQDASCKGGGIAVLALSMDGYSAAKCSRGPQACEALLLHAAMAIDACLPEDTTIARVLGGEFAVLLGGLSSDDEVLPVAARLLLAVKQPLPWEGRQMLTTASIGIALLSRDGGGDGSLLRAANLAMLAAQGLGGNRFRFCSMQMNERAARSSTMLALWRTTNDNPSPSSAADQPD